MPDRLIHLVRHGRYPMLDRGVLAGRMPGHALDADGRADADAIARALGERPIRLVVSGPLERTRETAAPLASRLGVAVTVDADAHEHDYGDWTGRRWSDLAGDPLWTAWHRERSVATVPNGETAGAVAERGLALLRRLRDRLEPGEEAAVFTHADVVRSVLASVLGMATELASRLEIAPASRSTVAFDDAGCPRVTAVNHPPPPWG